MEPTGSEDEALVLEATLEEVALFVGAALAVTEDQERTGIVLAEILDRLFLLQLDFR
jgi:cob(I)alamin adenosyltransferase